MSNDETRDRQWEKYANEHKAGPITEAGFKAGWIAALASVPVPTDHTALIAEAKEWVERHTSPVSGRTNTETLRVANLVAALESQQGNTTQEVGE